jgi:hypothetical protein
MANRMLNDEQLILARQLLDQVKLHLDELSNGNSELLFAYRRKIAKELTYAERSSPMVRRRLKVQKRKEQNNLCWACKETLPEKYVVLDRIVAPAGYVPENTRLICESCDRLIQASRGYK